MNTEQSESILLVDDDPLLLQSMRRVLRSNFSLALASSGQDGLELIRSKGPFAVVVSDHCMPGMSGVQFLGEVREVSPDSTRIMLTGNADMKSATEAVNDGQIFRFLTKPTTPNVLQSALEAGLEQYRLVTSQRVLLSETLQGSVKVLVDVLSLVNEQAFGRAGRIKAVVRDVVRILNVRPAWEIEIGAMLSTIGYFTVPPEILTKVHTGLPLTDPENATFLQHAKVGHDLIANIPRLGGVAKMVLQQESCCRPGAAADSASTSGEIPIGAKIIKTASDYIRWIDRGRSHEAALESLRKSGAYDPAIIDAIDRRRVSFDSLEPVVRKIQINQLRPGMIVARNIETESDSVLLIRKGQVVTELMLERLKNYSRHTAINSTVEVLETSPAVAAL